MALDHAAPQAPAVADPPLPPPEELRVTAMTGIVPFAMGTTNVIMQLARLPVGRGVAESRVQSGRADLHPVKRLRTTLSYLVIAYEGTEEERRLLKREVDRQHAQVRSRKGDDVEYRAFSRDLQLWVAACLYKGVEDAQLWLHGEPWRGEVLERVYAYSSRLGTTLQVRPEDWPADREAFERYWREGVAACTMDDVTRRYLQELVQLRALHPVLRHVFGPRHRLLTLGFLPAEFRELLGLPWTAADQRRFDAVTRRQAAVVRRLPWVLREFPLNLVRWDVRRRLRTGRPVV